MSIESAELRRRYQELQKAVGALNGRFAEMGRYKNPTAVRISNALSLFYADVRKIDPVFARTLSDV